MLVKENTINKPTDQNLVSYLAHSQIYPDKRVIWQYLLVG